MWWRKATCPQGLEGKDDKGHRPVMMKKEDIVLRLDDIPTLLYARSLSPICFNSANRPVAAIMN